MTPLEQQEPDWKTEYVMVLSALSWAVGFIEGLGHEDTYARRGFDRATNPVWIITPTEAP